jgi:hypothetical protein
MQRRFLIALLMCAHVAASAQNFIEEWSRSYSPASDRDARAAAIAFTSDGNLVVAGSQENAQSESDYSFLCYSPEGERLWTNSYTSPRGVTSLLNAVTFDEAGDLLATGTSDTISLNATGQVNWAAPFAGKSIAADRSFAYVANPTPAGGATLQIGNKAGPPVDIILDADPGADPDDMSDIAILNNMMTRGEVNILAVMGAHYSPFIARCIQVMNGYYGHTNIPIGVVTNSPVVGVNYGWNVWRKYFYPEPFEPVLPLPEATTLYRQILTSRPDHSVTIVFGGQLRNLMNVWNSPPDDISPLYGRALLARKVKRVILIAGFFDGQTAAEYNMVTDIEAALALNYMTNSVPITFVGIEQGNDVVIPSGGVSQMHPDNPVRYSHEIFGAPNRPSWTGLGLLLAARGDERNGEKFFRSVRGRVTVNPNGSSQFVVDEDSNQEHVIRTQGASRFIEILDDLLLTGPDISPLPYDSDRTGQKIWSRPLSEAAESRGEAEFVRVDDRAAIYAGGLEVSALQESSNRFTLRKYGEAGWLRWTARSSGLPEPSRTNINLRSMHVGADGIWMFGQYGDGGAVFKFNKNGGQLWHYRLPRKAVASRMIVDESGSALLVHAAANTIIVSRIGINGALLNEVEHRIAKFDVVEVEAVTLDAAGTLFIAARGKMGNVDSMLMIDCSHNLSRISVAEFASAFPGEARVNGIVADGGGKVYLSATTPTATGGTEMRTIKLTPAFQMEQTSERGLRFKCYAAANDTVTIEATADFKTWAPVAERQATAAGFLEFEDQSALDVAARFYRITRRR